MASSIYRLPILLALIARYVWCDPSPIVLDLAPRDDSHFGKPIVRRATPYTSSLYTYGDDPALVYLDLKVGTPAQSVRVQISMTDADILLVSNRLPTCLNGYCADGIDFNSNTSTSYNFDNSRFNFSFANGDWAAGDVATETVNLGGQSLTDVTILLEATGNITYPYLGLGYTDDEQLQNKYTNLPAQLFSQKLTNINGYSMFLDRDNARRGGRVLLGAVDTGKFFDKLETVPIFNSFPRLSWSVELSGMSVFDGAMNHSIPQSTIRVSPEISSSLLWLPSNVMAAIGQIFNATYENNYYITRFDEVNSNTTLDLIFGSTSISIPFEDLWYSSNATHVWLAMYDVGDDYAATIGAPFFKNAYVVADYTHNLFSLAPLNLNATSDNVTMISADGVAGLTGVSSQPNNGDKGSSSGGLSTGAKAGIGAGVAVGVLLLVAIGAFFLVRRRKQRKQSTMHNGSPGMGPMTTTEKMQSGHYNNDPNSPLPRKSVETVNTRSELPTYTDGHLSAAMENEGHGSSTSPTVRSSAASPTMSPASMSAQQWNTTTAYPQRGSHQAYQSYQYQPLRDQTQSSPVEMDASESVPDSGVKRKPIAPRQELA